MTDVKERHPCWCQGQDPQWDYHSPGGCGANTHYASACAAPGADTRRIDFEEAYGEDPKQGTVINDN